jgi:glycerophosphoryl diester phosphodiesterase
VQSFDHGVLRDLRQADPGVEVCPLTGLWQLSLSGATSIDAGYACPMAEMVVINPWMIRQAHAAGRKVFVWFGVIEHPVTMRLMLALGADGLIVDDPAALVRILGR